MPDAGYASAAMQFVGMVSSAVGAHDAAVSQKMAISAQAQMDKINARSSALAMNGQADLELINQKAGFEAMSFNSSMNTLNTEARIFDAKSGASLNMLGAETSAAMTTLQAGTHVALSTIQSGMQTDALEVGAHMAEQSAGLLELQAESTMLHGEWREQDSRMQYAQAKSRATVQMARGNLDMSEGTPLAQKVSIDVMSERAATMIQQDTLMQAFGQRTQASNSLLDAGIKRAQAKTITSMTAIQNTADLSIADMQAKGVVQQAALKSALTDMNAEFELHLAQSQSDWTAAMVHAGTLTAEAAANYKHTMATVLEENASASAAVKQAMSDGISPNIAFMNSILGSSGQVASSWYNVSRTTSGSGFKG